MSNVVFEGKLRMPRSGEWVTVNPDPTHRVEVLLLHDPEHGSVAIVDAIAAMAMPDLTQRCVLFQARNRDGENFFWPVAQPVPADHWVFQAMVDWLQYPAAGKTKET